MNRLEVLDEVVKPLLVDVLERELEDKDEEDNDDDEIVFELLERLDVEVLVFESETCSSLNLTKLIDERPEELLL